MTVPFRAYFLLGTHLCTEDQGFPLFSVYRRMNPETILYSLSTAIIYNHLYMMVLLKKAYLDFFSFLLPSHPSQCSTSVALFHISQVQLSLSSLATEASMKATVLMPVTYSFCLPSSSLSQLSLFSVKLTKSFPIAVMLYPSPLNLHVCQTSLSACDKLLLGGGSFYSAII